MLNGEPPAAVLTGSGSVVSHTSRTTNPIVTIDE